MSKVFDILHKEEQRQASTIELIASENFVSQEIREMVGSCFTNKYAEGVPGKRYYGGCQFVDEVETYCQEQWKKVFDTDYHVNVQPHSGSNANLAAYMSVLKPGDTVLSMSLDNGGHLTHGSTVNFSGKLYNFVHYDVTENGFIDYEDLRHKMYQYKPAMVVAGASAYSREIDFKRIKDIIDEVTSCGCDFYTYLMVDMSHIAGLIAAGYHQSPFGIADIITTTTHKTLRGPRAALIFCQPHLAKKVDSAVFPGTQGGPLMHVIAAKAIAAEEAQTEVYKEYIGRVVENAKAMANRFLSLGYKIVSGGTDNHMFLLDLSDTGVSGRELQEACDEHGITLNKNCIPNETRSPQETSGVRIGTPAMTTRGFDSKMFVTVADTIDAIVKELQLQKAELT